MHTVHFPEGVPPADMTEALGICYAEVFSHVGLTSVSILMQPGRGRLVIRDPKQRLAEPMVRLMIRNAIQLHVDPALRRIVGEGLLGPDYIL